MEGQGFVLCLLGFAATDFVITITLSAADATAHIVENPFVPAWLDHPIAGHAHAAALRWARSFCRGFSEAIDLAVVIVGVYLVLNVVVIGVRPAAIWQHPGVLPAWQDALFASTAAR